MKTSFCSNQNPDDYYLRNSVKQPQSLFKGVHYYQQETTPAYGQNPRQLLRKQLTYSQKGWVPPIKKNKRTRHDYPMYQDFNKFYNNDFQTRANQSIFLNTSFRSALFRSTRQSQPGRAASAAAQRSKRTHERSNSFDRGPILGRPSVQNLVVLKSEENKFKQKVQEMKQKERESKSELMKQQEINQYLKRQLLEVQQEFSGRDVMTKHISRNNDECYWMRRQSENICKQKELTLEEIQSYERQRDYLDAQIQQELEAKLQAEEGRLSNHNYLRQLKSESDDLFVMIKQQESMLKNIIGKTKSARITEMDYFKRLNPLSLNQSRETVLSQQGQ